MKNPITEWKNKQKERIIRQLELAYKIAEDLAKGATDADAGLHAMYGHIEAVIDCTRGKLRTRVKFLQEKIDRIWSENKEDRKQAFLEVEFTLFGMLVGYKGSDEKVIKPIGLKASYATVTEKMADELLKRQAETRKQTDLAEKMVSSLDSFSKMADKLSADIENKHKKEIAKIKVDAEMQSAGAYDAGYKDAKKELGKPIIPSLPIVKKE